MQYPGPQSRSRLQCVRSHAPALHLEPLGQSPSSAQGILSQRPVRSEHFKTGSTQSVAGVHSTQRFWAQVPREQSLVYTQSMQWRAEPGPGETQKGCSAGQSEFAWHSLHSLRVIPGE